MKLKWFYIPETNSLHWEKIISVGILSIALFIAGIYGQRKHSKLKQQRIINATYTIGVTDGSYKNLRSANPFVRYYYEVNHKIFHSTQTYPIEKEIITRGGKYYVKFSKQDPTNAELLLDKPVSDSIKKAPYGGWREPPY